MRHVVLDIRQRQIDFRISNESTLAFRSPNSFFSLRPSKVQHVQIFRNLNFEKLRRNESQGELN